MPAVRVWMACRQKSSPRMDAARQGEFDFAAGKLSMARHSSPCRGCGRRAAERQGHQLAERLLSKDSSPFDLSDGRRMDCLWATAISDRNGRAAVERQASMVWQGRVIGCHDDPRSAGFSNGIMRSRDFRSIFYLVAALHWSRSRFFSTDRMQPGKLCNLRPR
jgi:hypothetical protein